MRTRTLLLLAVTCGLLILVAGGVQLLRVSSSDQPATLAIGDTARAGDVTVTVLAARQVGTAVTVHVRLGGVDDPSGISGFALTVPGSVLLVDGPSGSHCQAITVAPVDCDLPFTLPTSAAGSKLLVFRRGEDHPVWRVATTP